jgi:hypothetical protein
MKHARDHKLNWDGLSLYLPVFGQHDYRLTQSGQTPQLTTVGQSGVASNAADGPHRRSPKLLRGGCTSDPQLRCLWKRPHKCYEG